MIGWLVALAVGAAAAGVVLQLLREREALRRRELKATGDLEHLQAAFARFAPSELVQRIANEGLAPLAEKRDVVVLFADIQGFTQMSDQLDPAVLVEILNGYFRAMTAAIAAHQGYVAKFMGDGLMALFGAFAPNPWMCKDAVDAALEMRLALTGYNAGLDARGLPTLRIGIGIHRGPVVAGVVGGDRLIEFTVIGDVVNVASRVESLTRKHGTELLVTGAVRAELGEAFVLRELPPVEVKGKPEPIATWAVEGRAAARTG